METTPDCNRKAAKSPAMRKLFNALSTSASKLSRSTAATPKKSLSRDPLEAHVQGTSFCRQSISSERVTIPKNGPNRFMPTAGFHRRSITLGALSTVVPPSPSPAPKDEDRPLPRRESMYLMLPFLDEPGTDDANSPCSNASFSGLTFSADFEAALHKHFASLDEKTEAESSYASEDSQNLSNYQTSENLTRASTRTSLTSISACEYPLKAHILHLNEREASVLPEDLVSKAVSKEFVAGWVTMNGSQSIGWWTK